MRVLEQLNLTLHIWFQKVEILIQFKSSSKGYTVLCFGTSTLQSSSSISHQFILDLSNMTTASGATTYDTTCRSGGSGKFFFWHLKKLNNSQDIQDTLSNMTTASGAATPASYSPATTRRLSRSTPASAWSSSRR
jgi:hypothetical protein